MIESLRIEAFAVVERAELEFGPGLNVITGETGAGKSLVLGALALLAGARARADVVREGASEARVEAVLRTEGLPELERALAEGGYTVEDHGVIVERTVSRSGRSRARVGGTLVPIAVLAELFGSRIEISSQHESQGLLRTEVQGRLLDGFGDLLPQRERVAALVQEIREADRERDELQQRADERVRRADFLAFQVREIDEAVIEPGQLDALGAERSRLLHAERLLRDAAGAAALLSGGVGGDASAAEGLRAATRLAESLAEVDAELAPLAERLRSAELEIADAASELDRYAQGVELDPARLEVVEERLVLLDALRRKYGETEEAVLEFRDAAAAELSSLGGADARLEKLREERGRRIEALEKDAARLTRGRKKAAKALVSAVTLKLEELAMAGARFEVRATPADPSPDLPCGVHGAETPEFLLDANASGEPRPLRRVASGGELSRVFLGLKNVLRRAEPGAALVFDEVDAGIGGGVADRVGGVLAELAGAHQVLCITHLPQIAARAQTHFAVRKDAGDGSARARVVPLSEKERVEEIARMAGGETITEATRRHARALLQQGR